MASLKILEWNHDGFQSILCSPEIVSQVETITEGIKARANANNTRGGTGFESATRVGKSYKSQRAIGFVFTTDYQSKVAEAEDKALSRAVK
jgi:hypothetical protein